MTLRLIDDEKVLRKFGELPAYYTKNNIKNILEQATVSPETTVQPEPEDISVGEDWEKELLLDWFNLDWEGADLSLWFVDETIDPRFTIDKLLSYISNLLAQAKKDEREKVITEVVKKLQVVVDTNPFGYVPLLRMENIIKSITKEGLHPSDKPEDKE